MSRSGSRWGIAGLVGLTVALLLLGDNRLNSNDSRFHGAVPVGAVRAKVVGVVAAGQLRPLDGTSTPVLAILLVGVGLLLLVASGPLIVVALVRGRKPTPNPAPSVRTEVP